MANKALITLGVLGIVGGIGTFAFGSIMAGRMTISDMYQNPGLYHQYQSMANVGIAIGIIGFLLMAVGAVLKGKEVSSTGRYMPPPSSIVHEFETFCPSCGTTIGYQGQAQCKACGRNFTSTKLGKREKPSDQGDAKASGTKFCRHCGKTILADSTFCEHCGNAV